MLSGIFTSVMRTIKRKESSPNYVLRFYLLSFLFIQRHQPFLATLPAFDVGCRKRLCGLELQPADGFVTVPVGELALGVVAGVALD